ncbi:MAG: tRNA (N6-threonylcarbamoyladenosine(37)-N6)-methyltransferase TrmO [Spirochaetota bacterium]
MQVEMIPIGYVKTDSVKVPRHWSVSDIEGELVIDKEFKDGLKDIEAGQKIVVLFYFHKSPPFTTDRLIQTPPHQDSAKGVFSICSPFRPNRLGLSVLEVVSIENNIIRVIHIDMLDGTPILDIKPWIAPEYH